MFLKNNLWKMTLTSDACGAIFDDLKILRFNRLDEKLKSNKLKVFMPGAK